MSTKSLEREDTDVVDHEHCHIVVVNDDHNPFDHVISTFVDVLGHTHEQAEQLAMIIHHKGSARVKNGTFEELQVPCEKLIAADLDATIE